MITFFIQLLKTKKIVMAGFYKVGEFFLKKLALSGLFLKETGNNKVGGENKTL